MLIRYRRSMAIAAAVLFATIILSFGPIRTVMADLLNVFRMDRAQVIAINSGDMAQLEQSLRGAGLDNLDAYAKVQVEEAGPSREMSPDAARQAVDYPLQLPPTLSGRQLRQVTVQPGAKVSVTPDIQKINSVLRAAGGKQLLPESITGKTFKITVPTAVTSAYGDPADQTAVLRLFQVAAPEMVVPEGVDAEQFRQILLQLPFLPDHLRQQLASVQDWWRTLPIPSMEGEKREVDVNGTPGILISSQTESERITLIWQRDGVWLALDGRLTLAEGRQIAGQLR